MAKKLNLDSIQLGNPITQCKRFFELVACVQIKNPGLGRDSRQHLKNRHTLWSERGGHRELVAVPLDGPPQYVFGARSLEPQTMFSQVREDFESWEKRRIGGLRANKSTVARPPWLAGFAVVQWAWPIGQDGSTWENRLQGHFLNNPIHYIHE